MKIAAPITVLGLMLCIGLNTPSVCVAQDDAPATKEVAPAPLTATRDNFVSISWRRTGGFAGVSLGAEVTGNVISRANPQRRGEGENGGTTTPRVRETRGLSNKQLDQLIEELSAANLPGSGGNYRQEGLFDGFNDTLVLILSDENGEDREFVIQNYGDKAPKGVQDFLAYFQTFVDKKFAPRRAAL